MRILVIGNGFDIAHGLKTKYTDFLQFIHLINESKTLNAKQLKIADEYRWLDDESWTCLFESRQNELNDRWEGFEAEIKRVVELISQMHMDAKDNKGKFNVHPADGKLLGFFDKRFSVQDFKCVFKSEQLDELKETACESLYRVIRQLEVYLVHEVNEHNIDFRMKEICEYRPDKIISFNYTNTFERIYGPIDSDNICYIHGCAKENYDISCHDLNCYNEKGYLSENEYAECLKAKKCNMILGIDENLDSIDSQEDNYCIQFKKFYQRIIKKTGNEYVDWLKQAEQDPNGIEIVFFGHSIDYIDREVITEIVHTKDIHGDFANVTILNHDDDSLERHVQNMVKIIGEEEVIRRVHGSNATLHFERQDNTRIKI